MYIAQTLVFETKNVDVLFEQGLWCLKIEMLRKGQIKYRFWFLIIEMKEVKTISDL